MSTLFVSVSLVKPFFDSVIFERYSSNMESRDFLPSVRRGFFALDKDSVGISWVGTVPS